MAKKKRIKINVSAKGTAKVGVVAKASYERKRKITEIIPPDVTRAKASAWLDLISPLTEWAALKGDALRFKRTQLRLQREDVLAEIVGLTRKQIGRLEDISKPIPNKFLVPFLEQASLEDPDSSLIDMWASLLASAAQEFSSHHVHFVSIISRLSPKQGEILKLLVGTESTNSCELAMDNIRGYFQSPKIRSTIEQLVLKLPEQTDAAFCEAIYTELNQIGIEVVHASAENLKMKDYFDITIGYSNYDDDDEVDYSILEAVGLIRRVDTDFFDVGNWALSLIFYHLTELGYYFCKACKIVRSDVPFDDTKAK
jgi:hypothetical protein